MLGILALIVACFHTLQPPSQASKHPISPASTTTFPPEEASPSPQNVDPRLERLPDGHVVLRDAVNLAKTLHRPESMADSDLEALDQIITLYHFIYKANPVGSENEEIMAQLIGKNPKKVIFFPPDHPNLSEAGALLDRWGNPYYFHPLSADRMDLRSAGDDAKLWTNDDVSLGLDEQATELQLKR
ncbi:MAG: hypothetical protein ACI8T1_002444 [Verrucomicrobiales bacterium]